MAPIQLTPDKWQKILDSIKQEFPPSYHLIREVQKVQLGFTVRRHRIGTNSPCIMLDFYNEAKKTWFVLKYM